MLKIGELARQTGTAVETIRYYEREGLLPAPARTDGNYRLYDDAHVQRLRFVRHCRLLDMTLDEIRLLLRVRDDPKADCADVNQVLDAHLAHVQSRIQALQSLSEQLQALRQCCATPGEAAHCGILSSLGDAALPLTRAVTECGGGAVSHVAASHGRHPG